MKIAILSDIHGNLSALNAVLNDLKKLNIDKYIIAGDNIIDCPSDNEVLRIIRSLNGYAIKGNREKYVLDFNKGLHKEWIDYKQMASVVWTHSILYKENLEYINQLPEQLNISLPGIDTIRVVHGSPFNVSEQIFSDKHPERIEKSLKGITEKVLICGHTHFAWHKTIYDKLIVNPGSVGVPFNDCKFAEYAILNWCGNHFTVTHHQVEYDLSELEQTFFESGLYKACTTWSKLTLQSIKEGRDVTSDFIKFAYKLAEKNGFTNLSLIPNNIWDKADEEFGL
ncbi:metallophosphoesterase family protein [Clostridium sp. YIM B02505]|uniref:Phosphoesterase n=1 Tax=Clostridium yunnanense TaxID=2800325 RepID=A0ABS1EMV1_9CLOT|nr:metallophosphoesterase family protein [Clostridium yunnanense]MBK1810686.1 metallophosphoesterase family protein [Clostridium yunnanense]